MDQQPSANLRIGLNAHLLSLSETYRGAGPSRYIYNLVTTLPHIDKANHYTVFLNEKRVPSTSASLTMRLTKLPTIHPPVRIFWEQCIQPTALIREEVDLLHCMAFVSPVLLPRPVVLTIYDLGFLRRPELYRASSHLYLKQFTPISARRAKRIIAISASTKKDIIRFFGVSPSKVDVVHCGVEEMFLPVNNHQRLDDFRTRRGLPEKMILFVGTLEPRKNLERLLQAYARLKKRKNLSHKLVIIGAKGWHYQEIFAAERELGLKGDVIFAGYVPQGELPLWYNAAELFVYPSLYEGFGLPPLEAMACGTPVITSNVSSLPEVVGEAGLTVDPMDSEELAEAMNHVLSDGALRQSMQERGLARAGLFSWAKAAQETVEVYRRALGR